MYIQLDGGSSPVPNLLHGSDKGIDSLFAEANLEPISAGKFTVESKLKAPVGFRSSHYDTIGAICVVK